MHSGCPTNCNDKHYRNAFLHSDPLTGIVAISDNHGISDKSNPVSLHKPGFLRIPAGNEYTDLEGTGRPSIRRSIVLSGILARPRNSPCKGPSTSAHQGTEAYLQHIKHSPHLAATSRTGQTFKRYCYQIQQDPDTPKNARFWITYGEVARPQSSIGQRMKPKMGSGIGLVYILQLNMHVMLKIPKASLSRCSFSLHI